MVPLSLAGGKKSEKRQVAKQREKLLQPLIEAADGIDAEIGYMFIFDHFNTARPRFEQTYISLGQEERAQVDNKLQSYLGAGGIRGMDEIQLDDYLSGLLEPEDSSR